MKPWTLVFTYFRSLSIAHLERSLFSLSKQTVKPDEVIIYDNDTEMKSDRFVNECERHFPRSTIFCDKHFDPSKRNASYCQNAAIRMAHHDTFIFTKADCIYHPRFCELLLAQKTDNPMEFIAPWLYQMHYWSEQGKPHDQVDHAKDLESLGWREDVEQLNRNTHNGQLHNHAHIDAPSFCTTKQAMELAGWYDEHIKSWGYWQLDLQGNMAKRGVKFKIIPKVLSWHCAHGLSPEEGERDLPKAQAEWESSPRRKDPAFQ